MLTIVLSESKFSLTEAKLVKDLFVNGLQSFHIRKKGLTKRQLIKYLDLIPSEFHNRIVIHSHHELAVKYKLRGIHLTRRHKKSKFYRLIKLPYILWRRPTLMLTTSVHHVSDLRDYDLPYNYVFLSPVFDSLSKKGYMSSFTELQIKNGLENTKYKVIALGGVVPSKITRVKELGFSGLAVVGFIWESEQPLDRFLEIYNAVESQQTLTTFGVVKPIKVSFGRGN